MIASIIVATAKYSIDFPKKIKAKRHTETIKKATDLAITIYFDCKFD